MFAVVDFDRSKSYFFTDFAEASDFITQYPVIETVVVVDLSEDYPAVEKLQENANQGLTTVSPYAIVYVQLETTEGIQ